jgi:hypothetical protein
MLRRLNYGGLGSSCRTCVFSRGGVMKCISVGLVFKWDVTCQSLGFVLKWDVMTCISGSSV